MTTTRSSWTRLRRSAVGSPPRPPSARGLPLVIAVLVGIGAACVLFAVSVGAVTVPLTTVWQVVLDRFAAVPATGTDARIVWDVRVPRVLMSLLAGAGLALAGTVIQAVVRNPLGDPYLLGIVPGASVGAVVVIVAGTEAALGLSLSAAAFVGAFVAFLVTFALGREGGRFPPGRLILAGVAVGYLFTAVTFFLQTRAAPNQVFRVLFWSLGSLAGVRWQDLAVPALVVVLAVVWLTLQGRRVNALVTGDEMAASLGVDVGRFQLQLMAAAALLTGVIVAVVGGIGFVGLMVPHICRFLVGPDHRRVMIVSVLVGGPFLVVADTVARVVVAPAELPVGIITSAIGAPFLLWLLRGRSRTTGA